MRREVVFGFLFGAIAAGGFASETDGIFNYKLGRFEIYVLVEGERDGNASIIPGADNSVLQRYIPAAGFKQSTNAFLIKAPEGNILVDAGTGQGGVILEKVKKLGVEPNKLDAVLITHLHGDHFGGLQSNGKALFPNAKICLAEREYTYFTKTQVNQGAVSTLALYGSNVITFESAAFGETPGEIIPGISPIANYGHTPGHTVFLVQDGGASMIIGGDYLHVALVQFPMPDISATYDMDQKEAAASRRQLMDYAAKNRIPLGGMHVVYPGVGNVETDGSGYRFIPAVENY
jgi:glyoxylase-like metal-dependent hydrolase (beta-lactamase superfamily II)